ncbi:MAG: hypothetical protein ACO2Z9_07570 [Crocinitomicaceae bacterium]
MAKLIFLIGYIFYLLALLLPYLVYDQLIYQSEMSSAAISPTSTFVSDILLMTYKTPIGYLSIIWMVYPISKILRNSKNAYKSVMLSSIILLSIYSIIYFVMTSNPDSIIGFVNVELSLGFWTNVHGTVLCFLAGVLMWLSLIRETARISENHDLLDDSI